MYLIWAKKYDQGITRCFWGPNFSGYTINLKKAGRFSLKDIRQSYKYPIVTKKNFLKIKNNSNIDHAIIKADMVELLGEVMTCVKN